MAPFVPLNNDVRLLSLAVVCMKGTCCQPCNTWRQVQAVVTRAHRCQAAAVTRGRSRSVDSGRAGDQLTLRRERLRHTHTQPEPEPGPRSHSVGVGANSSGGQRLGARAEVIKRTLYGAITDIMT